MEDQPGGGGRGKKDLSDFQEHAPSNWFSTWEEQLLVEADNESSFENQFNNYQRHADQRLWFSFQNTASSIAQLYKDRLQDRDCGWAPFQNAAASATNLYKESVEMTKTNRDLAIQCGYQRRNKELLAWVRKRKRHIRREDLMNFLCGRSSHRSCVTSRSSKQSPSYSGSATSKPEPVTHEGDLQQFQEAVSMQGLSGAMAGISVRSHPGSPNPRSLPLSGIPSDLTNFIAEEFRRRRNDPSPPSTSATASRGRSNSPCVTSRKRNPSSESSSSDCPTVAKKSRK